MELKQCYNQLTLLPSLNSSTVCTLKFENKTPWLIQSPFMFKMKTAKKYYCGSNQFKIVITIIHYKRWINHNRFDRDIILLLLKDFMANIIDFSFICWNLFY